MVEKVFEEKAESEKLRESGKARDYEDRAHSQLQSIRSIVMRRIEDFSTANTNTKKVMILDGLITFCANFVKNPEIQNKVREAMKGRELNLYNDFLHQYKAESEGNDWNIILENEYRKILPALRDIWYTVEQELSKQGYLPWAFPDPRQELRDKMFRETLKAIEKFRPPEQSSRKKEEPDPFRTEPPSEPEKEPESPVAPPPWEENDLPDPAEEKKAKLRKLLEDPDFEEREEGAGPARNEDMAKLPAELQEELDRQELEEAEKIWGRETILKTAHKMIEERR